MAVAGEPVYVARLTSDELAARLRGPEPVALLLPVGAIEPHGPHLPLDTDVIISRSAAVRATARLRARGVHAFVAPDVAYGVTECARGFAGAAGVPPASLDAYLRGVIAGWLENGAAHVAVVSNHLEPGHESVVRAAVASFPTGRCCAATPLARRWARTLSDEFRRGACHAGEYETSIVLAAEEGDVRTDVAATLPAVEISLSDQLRAGVDTFARMGMTRAYAGAPARATREHGDAMLERLAEMIAVEVIESMGLASRD